MDKQRNFQRRRPAASTKFTEIPSGGRYIHVLEMVVATYTFWFDTDVLKSLSVGPTKRTNSCCQTSD